MAGITFPQDVQNRLELEALISRLSERPTRDIVALLKLKKILPISFGLDPPPESTKPSITTTAIAAARLPGHYSPGLFRQFFVRCDRALQKSKTLSSGTFGNDNPITAAFVALAYARFSRKAERPYRFAIDRLLDWISHPGTATPLRGYPAMLAVEAFSTLDGTLPLSVRRRANRAQARLFDVSQTQSMQQVAYYHSGHSAYFDPGELAYLILLGCRTQALFWTSPIVTEAVQILFKCQSEDSLWHSSHPFWYAAGRGTFLASSQIMCALVRILRRRLDLFRMQEKRVIQYVKWLHENIAFAEEGPFEAKGWAAEAGFSRDRIEFYVTVENIRVLHRIRTIIREINREDLLHRSGLTVNWKPMSWQKLLPTDLSLPAGNQIKVQLDSLFIRPAKDNKRLDRSALVLYGPPGTSKTSIAEALADALKTTGKVADALKTTGKPWPFITITPGDFIAGGEAMAEINAANIFRILGELPKVVILFDEIDQLLRDRNQDQHAGGGALQFMTTSMLTKFQNLRQHKINVFVLTTNKFEGLDSAIRRAGRFDRHMPVMPPDAPSRVAILTFLLKKFDADRHTQFSKHISKRDLSVVANQTCLFTFPELQGLVSDVLSFLPSNATKRQIKEKLLLVAKGYSRATSFGSYSDRKGAEREMAILISMISQAEFQKLSDGDRKDFVELVKKVSDTEFRNLIPTWASSRAV